MQRRWRRKHQKSLLDKYKTIFQSITSKLQGEQEKINDLSDIDPSFSDIGLVAEHYNSSIFEN